MKVLLFGGTAEGRELAVWMKSRGMDALTCVASDYGGELLPGDVKCHVGRLDQAGMETLMSHGFTHVVDATHPYAQAATRTIAAAAESRSLPRLRLVRDGDVEGDWKCADSPAAAARMLLEMPGNVLLTTGSKELDAFALPGLLERCYPRVLPSLNSLSRCLELGFPAKQVICMQGPFTKELNAALMRQYEIAALVTKATGAAGGFWEKVEAAKAAGASLLVIGRPVHETGLSLEEVKVQLARWEAEE